MSSLQSYCVAARLIPALIPGLACSGPALAQTGCMWHELSFSPSPPARIGHDVAYDSARGRLVVFGGQAVPGPCVILGDTWELGPGGWEQKQPAVSPPARYGHCMVYDSARGVVVLFGGQASGAQTGPCFGDTWEWDGSTWELASTRGPSARWVSAMADTCTGRVVLFGGEPVVGGGPVGDTWEWDGTVWTQQFPVTPPPSRDRHSMSAKIPGRALLFGGHSGGGHYNDLWQWDSLKETWQEQPSLPVPTPISARRSQGMAYDQVRRTLVVAGGSSGGGSLNDTWELGPTGSWSPGPSTPLGVAGSVAYDPIRTGMLHYFGGWDGQVPVDAVLFYNCDCPADCNRDGVLTVADFGCFQTRFVAGCP